MHGKRLDWPVCHLSQRVCGGDAPRLLMRALRNEITISE